MGISVAPHPCQQLESLFCMFVLAILINLLWHHSVVFNLHFPNKNVKHLFMFLFAICIFSLIKCHCKSFAHFFLRLDIQFSYYCLLRVFMKTGYKSFITYVISEISPSSQSMSFNSFSHVIHRAKVFIPMQFNLSVFFFFPTMDYASHIVSKKCLLNPRSQMFSPMFSSSLQIVHDNLV